MEIQGITGDLESVKPRRGHKISQEPATPVSGKDTVEISREAEVLSRNRGVERLVKEIVDKLPEIRDERVTQARERVESGYYDRKDVKYSIVDQLIDQFGSDL